MFEAPDGELPLTDDPPVEGGKIREYPRTWVLVQGQLDARAHLVQGTPQAVQGAKDFLETLLGFVLDQWVIVHALRGKGEGIRQDPSNVLFWSVPKCTSHTA